MNVFQRSFQIAKLSFGTVNKDKEMLLFPFFSTIFSIGFLIGMLFPTIILALWNGDSTPEQWEVMEYVLLFVTYLGLAVIATFFNVCVVYTAKERFEGRNPTFFRTIGYAFSKLHLIFLWGLLSATVGVILAALRNAANKSNSVGGKIGANAAAGIGSFAWSITTIFVVPAMVYHNLTPLKAIKKSVQTLKKTWGESILKYFGMGIVKFLVYFLIVIMIGVGIYFTMSLSLNYLLITLGIGLLLLIIAALLFACADQVFDTALFVYADKGKIPEGWNKEVLATTFQ